MEYAMLSAISLENFKSFRKARLPLGPLTLLIGANAAGKSNALEGIRLLHWLAQGQKLSTIRHEVQDSDSVVRGRIEDLAYCSESEFTIAVDVREFTLLVSLGLRDGELHVVNEILTTFFEKFPLYRVVQAARHPSYDIDVEYNNFSRGGNKPRITCTDQKAVFTQLDSPASFAKTHERSQKEIPTVSNYFQQLLGSILFLDPQPSQMRDAEYKNERTLRPNGRCLSSVLWNLCQHEGTKAKILELIQSLPEQQITDIAFEESGKQKVLLMLTETFGGQSRTWDATLLSDGTLRVLAIAAALLSAAEGSLLVIEEVDNGVHPSRAHGLLQSMYSIATARNLRLLLSTHNPALMDAIPDASLEDVVFCYRDPAEGDSCLVRLGDTERFASLVSSDSLGALVTSNALDRHVKKMQSKGERKQHSLKWLELLDQDTLHEHMSD